MLQNKLQYFETLTEKVSDLYHSNRENQTFLKIFLQQIVTTIIRAPHPTVSDTYYNIMKKIWRMFSICKLPKLSFECAGSAHNCRYDFSRAPRNRLCGYINVLNPWVPSREHTVTIRVHHMFNLMLNYTTIALPTGDGKTSYVYAHIFLLHINLMPWDSIDKNTFTIDLGSPDRKFYMLHGSMTPFYEIVPFNTVHYSFWRVIQSMRMQLVVAYTVVNPQVCIVFFYVRKIY